MIKRIMALLTFFGALLLAFTLPASATVPAPAVQVNAAPDGGHHGDWATDTFVRSTTVTANDEKDSYTVTIADSGTFTTIPGASSPRDGVALPNAPVTGVVNGTMTFQVLSDVAPDGSLLPATINGKPDTSNWPRRLFSANAEVNVSAGDYSWTYKTDCESWTDASNNNDGSDDAAGDITGKLCPSSPASESSTASPSSTGVVATSSRSAAPVLPVTGAPLGAIAGAGAAVLVGGALLLAFARRRRSER
jgi:hypothetical protein